MTTSFRHLSALLAFLGTAALSSFAVAQECTSNADCSEGEYCSPAPCPAIDCDPADPSCPECPDTGICMAGVGGPDECTTNADCSAGFVCESLGDSDCAVPSCPEGMECPEVDCTSEEFFACVPDRNACASDADCAEGLQCETYTYEQCSGGGSVPPCAPGEACPDPEPVETECETVTESYCLPPYLGACAADADCGPGFTCEEAESCSCSGSSGSSGSSGGSEGTPPPLPPDGSDVPPSEGTPEEDCSCEPSGEFYCELIEVECTTDADCIDGFVCVDSPDAGVPCTSTPDGTEDCGEPVESPSLCLPESYGDWVGAGGGFPTASDDLASESGGAPRNDAEQNAASSDEPTEEDGCSSTGAPAASMPLWLGLAALIGFRRRKA